MLQQNHYLERLVRPAPDIASRITQEVENFALKWDLRWEAWHQDEPIWYVWQSRPHDGLTVTRTVQVSAFRVRDEPPMLRAIAFGQLVDDSSGQARVLEKPKKVVSQPLVGPAGKYPEIYALIQEAWEAAQAITSTDFPDDGKKIRLTPRPSKWPP